MVFVKEKGRDDILLPLSFLYGSTRKRIDPSCKMISQAKCRTCPSFLLDHTHFNQPPRQQRPGCTQPSKQRGLGFHGQRLPLHLATNSGEAMIFLQDEPIMLVGPLRNLFFYNLHKISVKRSTTLRSNMIKKNI